MNDSLPAAFTDDAPSFVDSLAFCTLRLGTAYLLSGEVEEATKVVGEGAVLASQNRSVRLTREVRAAHAGLEPWRETAAVRELDERLMGVGIEGEAYKILRTARLDV